MTAVKKEQTAELATDTLTIRKVGNSLGVILPKGLLESMNLRAGDQVYAVHTPEGLRLTPYDPDFADAMDATRDYMRRHRDALKELAK